MARFAQAVLLATSVLGVWAAGSNVCVKTIKDMEAKHPMDFAKLFLATGKSLPYDAGKYVMCLNAENTRYFLVKMSAELPPMNTGLAAAPAQSDPKIPMEVGVCVPNVCERADVIDLLVSGIATAQKFLPELGLLHVSNITATSPQLDLKQEGVGGIIAAVAVGLLALLVLVSSAVVLAKQPRPQELPVQEQQLLQLLQAAEQTPRQPLVIEAFSMFGKSGTVKKLMEIPIYKPTDCLNGLRVLSMAWIILGHTFLMPQGVSGYTNQEDIVMSALNTDAAERSPWLALIISAQSGVDTFFFLSGFLLSYLTLKELRNGKMKTMGAIVLRYLRLTPSLALTMLVFYKIWVHLGYGPFAVRFQDSINSRCDGSWWSELTYTLNFLPFDSNKVCMGWTWYLGDDMIFFIIALLVLPVYHRSRFLGWASVIGLTGISFGVTTYLVVKHNLSIYVFDDTYQEYSYWAYSKPYTRIPAYFVGIAGAWVLDEMEQRGITRETRNFTSCAKTFARVGAAFTGAVLLFLVFIPTTDFGDHKNSWGTLASVLYINLSRPVWALCWAAMTLLCYYDLLPLVNGFLAHPYWTPLARLTYGAYLVHPLVIKLAAGRSLQYYSFNSLDMVYRFIGNVVMAYTGSALLWVLCERPCMTLFSPARKPRRNKANGGQLSRNNSTDISTASTSNPDLVSVGSDVNQQGYSVEKKPLEKASSNQSAATSSSQTGAALC